MTDSCNPMAIHSSTIAWKIPWTEELGRLQSMGLQRVRHNWATSLTHSVALSSSLPYLLVLFIVSSFSFLFFFFTSLVAQMVKCLPTMWETRVQSLGREDPLEKEMATHSSILAWKIPWTEEPGRPQSMGSQRVKHDWATFFFFFWCLYCS